jgi:protein arginine N-methyltransferase 1
LDAFRQAIEASVKPGDVVIDLGTGTGILAHFAVKAGASKVYAIEVAEIYQIALELLRRNGDAQAIQPANLISYLVQGIGPADVLMTETLGDIGLDEGIMGAVIDARIRFLKPNAIIVPRQVEVWCGPIESASDHRRVSAWKSDLFGYDASAIRPLAANTIYQMRFSPQALLAPAKRLCEIDLRKLDRPEVKGRIDLTIARDGTMHGIGGYFSSELSPGVSLSNEPSGPENSWRQCYLPLEEPVDVRAGERMAIEIEVLDNASEWRWTVLPADGRRIEQSTARGFKPVTR